MMVVGRDKVARGKPFQLSTSLEGFIEVWKDSLGGPASVVGFAAYLHQSSTLRSR